VATSIKFERGERNEEALVELVVLVVLKTLLYQEVVGLTNIGALNPGGDIGNYSVWRGFAPYNLQVSDDLTPFSFLRGMPFNGVKDSDTGGFGGNYYHDQTAGLTAFKFYSFLSNFGVAGRGHGGRGGDGNINSGSSGYNGANGDIGAVIIEWGTLV